MFGLSDEIGSDVTGACGVIGEDDDLARTGDAVDGDLPEDVPLGQRDEHIAGADDHVHRRNSFNAVSQRRHRLGAADAIHFFDAKLMTDREQVGVESS